MNLFLFARITGDQLVWHTIRHHSNMSNVNGEQRVAVRNEWRQRQQREKKVHSKLARMCSCTWSKRVCMCDAKYGNVVDDTSCNNHNIWNRHMRSSNIVVKSALLLEVIVVAVVVSVRAIHTQTQTLTQTQTHESFFFFFLLFISTGPGCRTSTHRIVAIHTCRELSHNSYHHTDASLCLYMVANNSVFICTKYSECVSLCVCVCVVVHTAHVQLYEYLNVSEWLNE